MALKDLCASSRILLPLSARRLTVGRRANFDHLSRRPAAKIQINLFSVRNPLLWTNDNKNKSRKFLVARWLAPVDWPANANDSNKRSRSTRDLIRIIVRRVPSFSRVLIHVCWLEKRNSGAMKWPLSRVPFVGHRKWPALCRRSDIVNASKDSRQASRRDRPRFRLARAPK